ncbi:hypothetical protein GMST_24120 [Geomonas silvestris]|uniref:J domain-containing protein n=1 Tax=Geomonas silvestris TaxID=2740184 RepID=A0A6V8MJF2_9BACT|nr:molecular chaperone DnaJ [Geomonas silvestris]GFO60087.1 hypothetical protein GMST_24120 [Geomonas silvestris]
MRAGNQQRLPEEIELDLKQDALAALQAEHGAARAELQKLRGEITRFEGEYEKTVGRRIAELERIEGEIAQLTGSQSEVGRDAGETRGAGAGNASQSEEESEREDLAADPVHLRRFEDLEIKALYREVAKAIHPDLVGSGADENQRHELMAKANRAYASQDRHTLEEILRNWRPAVAKPRQEPLDLAHQLVQVIRQIAQEREDIAATRATVQDLKGSYVYRFKLRVEASLAQGMDLLGEMTAAAEMNIARAKKRLALLRGEQAQVPVAAPEKAVREICFPTDRFEGTLYLRERNSFNFSQWRKIGPAHGCLKIGADQAVRLDVKADEAVEIGRIRNLKPDDLHSLFLYEVADRDLESIMHLTGLEELYLSGQGLTDAALRGLNKLTNLKRLYLYQTVITDHGLAHLERLPSLKGLTCSGNSITEKGLATFQKAIPGVKTVSFPWRYNK